MPGSNICFCKDESMGRLSIGQQDMNHKAGVYREHGSCCSMFLQLLT